MNPKDRVETKNYDICGLGTGRLDEHNGSKIDDIILCICSVFVFDIVNIKGRAMSQNEA